MQALTKIKLIAEYATSSREASCFHECQDLENVGYKVICDCAPITVGNFCSCILPLTCRNLTAPVFQAGKGSLLLFIYLLVIYSFGSVIPSSSLKTSQNLI